MGGTNANGSKTALKTLTSSVGGLTITQQNVKKVGNVVSLNCELLNTSAVAAYTVLFTLPAGIRPYGYLFTSAVGLSTPNLPIQINDSNGNVTSPWAFPGGNVYYELNVAYITEEGGGD